MDSSASSSPRAESLGTPTQTIHSPRSVLSTSSRPLVNSARQSQSPNPMAAPQIPLLLSTSHPDIATLPGSGAESSVPSRRPRKRRSETQEVAPTDYTGVIALCMSPFMPGQDAMFNQNRLVRNEAIVARHLSNLERSYSKAESNRTRTIEDIYRILTDHRKTIDRLAKAMEDNATLRSGEELKVLSQSHSTTHEAIKVIIQHLSNVSTTTSASLSELKQAVSEFVSEDRPATAADESRKAPPSLLSNDPVHPESGWESSLRAGNSSTLEDRFRGKKRQRRDIYPNFSPIGSRLSPLSEDHIHVPESREVVYGPINDHLNAENVIKEAVRKVGISPFTIQSVHAKSGMPSFFSIRFSNREDAHKFVNLAGPDLDGLLIRRAYLTDEPLSGSLVPTPESSTSTTRMKPWLL